MAQNDSERQSAIHREMYRKSLDKIRVYNPTEQDHVVVWDGFKHVIPSKHKDMGWGKGERVVDRYIAEKYCRDMKNKLIYEQGEEFVEKLIERATEDMRIKYQTDPYEKQRLYNQAPSINDEKLIKKIYDTLWLGVEEKFGIDEIVEENDGIEDNRPVEERILLDMDRPVKRPTVEEVTNEQPAKKPGRPSKKVEAKDDLSVDDFTT